MRFVTNIETIRINTPFLFADFVYRVIIPRRVFHIFSFKVLHFRARTQSFY